MLHASYVSAINSSQAQALSKIQGQWDGFLLYIGSLGQHEKCMFLKQLLIDNGLIEPCSPKMPLLYVMQQHLILLNTTGHKYIQVFIFIEHLLFSIGYLRLYRYKVRKKKTIPVYVFLDDVNLLSKDMIDRMYRVHAHLG